MHHIIADVLERRDLSKAANLFDDKQIRDADIIKDMPLLIHHVKLVSNSNGFTLDYNDQSVVEICLARILSAVKDTGTIELHIDSLVDLLETCLHHDLVPALDDHDPPHAKIASDLVSCIFLNHNSRGVMMKVVPVAVKFLHRGNKDLSRNLASYLSLTVIQNPDILIRYIQVIIDAIIGGNHSLIKVLPKIYAIMPDRKQFHDHVMALTCLLPLCEISERLSLLNLFSLMSKTSPSLLESNLPVFVRCLSHHQTVYPTLQIMLNVAQFNPELLAEYLDKITDTCLVRPNVLPPCAQFIGIVGRNVKERSKECLNCLSKLINSADQTNIIMLLREMNSIVRTSPQALQKELQNTISEISSKKHLIGLPSVKSYLNQLSMPDYERKWSDDVRRDEDRSIYGINHYSSASSSICSSYHQHRKAPPMINFNQNYYASERPKPLPSPTSPTSIESRCGQSYFSDSGISPSINTTSSNGSSTRFHSRIDHIPKIEPSMYLPISRFCSPPSSRSESGCISSPMMYYPSSIANSQTTSCQACNHHYQFKNITEKRVRMPKLQNLTFSRHLSSPSNFPSTSCYGTNCTYGQTLAHRNILQCSVQNSNKDATSNCHIYSIKEISDDAKKPVSSDSGLESNYSSQDVVQRFCDKHLGEIEAFVNRVRINVPLPIRCSLEERKNKKNIVISFSCGSRKHPHCLSSHDNYLSIRTKHLRTWIHLMFLALQADSETALSCSSPNVAGLRACWDAISGDKSFQMLVTSSFPSPKEQEALVNELRQNRYFDRFEFDVTTELWSCFVCNASRTSGLSLDKALIFNRAIKEKKPKWSLFKRWQFNLTGDTGLISER